MIDLHRHDEFSFYDGSGKAKELAKIAKEKGHTALGLTNHGNTSGLVQHYDACKEEGIKPVMGCEGYFLPKYKEQQRGYHLILIAKDLEGFKNLNIIQSKGELQKFYNPIWDFDLLEEYHEGLICTSACVAGYLGQCIKSDNLDKAKKYLKKLQSIFGDDFYIEIQPYDVDEEKDGIDNLSDIEADLDIYFSNYFSTKFESYINHDSGKFDSYGISTYLRDDRGDMLKTRYTFLDNVLEQLEGNIEFVWTDRFRTGYYARYDIDDNDFIEQQIAFRILSSCDCWHVDLGFSDKTNPDRQKVILSFTLGDFGGITQSVGVGNDNNK